MYSWELINNNINTTLTTTTTNIFTTTASTTTPSRYNYEEDLLDISEDEEIMEILSKETKKQAKLSPLPDHEQEDLLLHVTNEELNDLQLPEQLNHNKHLNHHQNQQKLNNKKEKMKNTN